ncbi:molybdate ABC transporter substrate-binding protein [Actibacterium sp.]|uniref:molybdate ABC transporter substrate-binding protein n=1 Tax=Actibacterium sp. TaxID=1872125 RepID=UPI00257F4DCF|nr:molybdate ABC transporter substrate-binding protein [Actibacterium sp.]
MKNLLLAVFMALAGGSVRAEEINVAVAANFTEAATEIAAAFQAATGHRALLSFGSTGQLFTQITQNAPFDVFLAADSARPARAVKEGLAVAGTNFTYAIGKLVLWSADPGLVTDETVLSADGFTRIALANPETAPYGAAAVEVMRNLGVHDGLEPKFVRGNSIAQTYQFVATGNAELGFVALSQLAGRTEGSAWIVPDDLYAPIRQDAVLLNNGAGNPAAQAFVGFLKGPEAAAIIARYGYGADAG